MMGYAWQGDMCGGWHVRQSGGVYGGEGLAWQGACVAGETVTESDSTHRTGMHSCEIIPLFPIRAESAALTLTLDVNEPLGNRRPTGSKTVQLSQYKKGKY